MAEKRSAFDTILGIAQQWTTPFVRSFAYGKEKASEMELAEERMRYNALNGSGANDPSGFARLPKSEQEAVTANPFGFQVSQSGVLVIALAAVLVAVLLVRK